MKIQRFFKLLRLSGLCYLLPLVFLSANLVYSQLEKNITGQLIDETGKVVIGASVLLKSKSGDVVTYGISDKNGGFALSTKAKGVHILEVSHISHTLYTEKVVLTEDKNIYSKNIVLKSDGNKLEEVIIQERRAVATQKGDTLRYNFDAYTTGNEQKLKEVIKKLPGLEIDENGRIKSQGKVIDNFLVNGKPFFGDNHKIATDNLNAKMIGSIDVLKNYETFDAAKEIEGSSETALNIKIKEEYQGKPTGNLEAYGAYKERYRLHTNIFSFAKKYNLSFIGDVNNTGQQPISLLDYIQMKRSDDIKSKEDEISSINSNSDLPGFLQENSNRVQQQSKFGAINAVFTPLPSMAIEAFSILNTQKIKQRQFTEQTIFSQSQNIFSEEFIEDDKEFFINQTHIKAEYKPNSKSILKYTLDYKPQNNDFVTDINGEIQETEQNTTQKIDTRGYTLGQNLGYTSRLDTNKLLSINAFSSMIEDKTQLYLSSTRSLFDINNIISQELENKTDEYGVYSKYTQRTGNHILKFNLGYVWQKSKFSGITNSDKAISQNNQNYLYTGVSAEEKEGLLQYKALVNFRRYNTSFSGDESAHWLFLPMLEAKLSFSETHFTSLSYKRQTGFPNAKQLNSFPYVRDYRNFRFSSNADYNRPVINNRFNFRYFYFNLYSGTQILLNSSYNKTKDDIGVNSEVIGIYNYSNLLNIPSELNWVNTLRFQTRINPIKTTFKLELNYSLIEFNNFINGIQNKATNQQFKIKPSLASYFKDSWINYDIGIDYQQNNTSFELTELKNEGSRISPFINLKGKFSTNWSYSVNNSVAYFRTSTIKRNFYQLDFEVKYNKDSSKFSYWLSGDNILNISSAQVVEAITRQNSISRTVINQIPGYIGVGVSYEF